MTKRRTDRRGEYCREAPGTQQWGKRSDRSSVGSRHARPYERQRPLLSGTPLGLERLALCHVVGDEEVLDLADQVVAYITDVAKRPMRD